MLVCCGGGGLSAGVALALEAAAPGLRVRTVEPAGFDDVARSLVAGERLGNAAATGSICDAILTPRPGALTFPVLQRLAGPGLAVSDAEALAAMRLAFAHLRLVLEPGGAVSLAAALFRPAEIGGDAVICIASGGNVEARRCSPRRSWRPETAGQGMSGPSRNSDLSATPGLAPGNAALKNSAILPEL